MSSIASKVRWPIQVKQTLTAVPINNGGEPASIYPEGFLIPALLGELARSRRYGQRFALALAGVHHINKRFDYRDEDAWRVSLAQTEELLGKTRHDVDQVFRFGPDSFALLIPESGPEVVKGLVKRLRKLANACSPKVGEPGGPLPLRFGATFFPSCSGSAEGLITRANLALLLAEREAAYLHLDGAGWSEEHLAAVNGSDLMPVRPRPAAEG